MTVSAPGFVALIPARLQSTRLPRKPLADIGGLPMVVRVARQAAQSGAMAVYVAADAAEIIDACEAHGVRALLTRSDHASGSDRLAEACVLLGLADEQIVVNVQGDEPLIDPTLINACAATLAADAACEVATVAHPISEPADFGNPNIVKVVLDARSRALYFSRAPIPCWRDAPAAGLPPPQPGALRHLGLYAYRAGFLKRFPGLRAAPIEQTEALEQLRVLWHGVPIAVHVSRDAPAAGVDTPADLERARAQVSATPR